MIEISIHNYELYALDYIEGRLSDANKKAFEDFLLLHPEISEEMEDLNSHFLKIDEDEFTHADELKKGALLSSEINLENAEVYFAAYHEGDLNLKEKASVEAFLSSNPEKINDFEQLALLRFEADDSVVFPLKGKLKKMTGVFTLRNAYRVAAILLLAFSLGLYLFTPQEVQRYSSRDTIPAFNNNSKDPIDTVLEEKIRLAENTTSIKQEIPKSTVPQLKKVVADPLTENTRTLADQNTANINPLVFEEVKEDIRSKEVDQKENTILNTKESTESNAIVLNSDVNPNEVIAETLQNSGTVKAIAKDEAQSILKFKRPFRGKTNEDELLASNDSETVLKIANPLKRKGRNGISFGPIKVKKK